MSLKQEIETWVAALAHYDNQEFAEALKAFDNISDTSKILFNMGVIHATLGEHEKAVECYQRAVKLDVYLAVAYFQQGVSNFLMGDFEEALANFNDTLLYLRGNNNIDYEQLGLKFKLYSCEVLFNRGLCYIYLQQKDAGMQDLSFAAKEKVVPDHDVIDEAIREEAEGYTVFSIPVGILYRPNEAKVKNLKTKDYLGKARLVAASDRNNAFTGFAGSEIKNMRDNATLARDDRPEDKLSYAATNLVKTNLQSRARQQSEPPINRNVFPPTPPPENERPGAERSMSRAQSVRNGPKPQPLELGRAAFDQPSESRRPTRSVSERPRMREPSYSSRSDRSDLSRRRADDRDYRRDEPPPSRRRAMSDEDDDAYPDELYDMYSNSGSSRSGGGGGSGSSSSSNGRRPSYSSTTRRGGKPASRPMYIEEEDEEDDYDGSDGVVDDGDFEMIPSLRARLSSSRAAARAAQRSPTAASIRSGASGTTTSTSSISGGGSGGRARSRTRNGSGTVTAIRVKVHAEDTRYVFVTAGTPFAEFVDGIRVKFGLRRSFKVKYRDEGDMITMSDQDDLDMAVLTARQAARKEGVGMGRMEVWVQEI